MLAPEGILSIPLPVLDGSFGFTPWETHPSPTVDQIPTAQSSGSVGSDRVVTPAEERKLRRMVSNRESARRSRMRKQRHLEDLRCQMNRLRSENRDLANRLGAVSHYCALFQRDNDRLQSELALLRRRMSEIRRVLLFRQLQRLSSPPSAAVCSGFASGSLAAVCGGFAPGNELNTSSLIV